MRNGPGWVFINHTADIRMQVLGKDLAELFTNAALALSEALTDNEFTGSVEVLNVKLEANIVEELLIDWLREILFFHETKRILPVVFEFKSITSNILDCSLTCRKKGGASLQEVEIKGVTYHGLSIKKSKTGYSAKIIFDI